MKFADIFIKPKQKEIASKSPDFEKRLDFFKCHLGDNKLAIITDNTGEKYFCEITPQSIKDKNLAADFSLYDQKFKLCSNMSYYWIGDRLFLSSVYTAIDSRGKGLAKKLNSLSNYVLKDLADTRIIGNYEPFNSTISPDETIKLSKEELDVLSRRFYLSNGYEFITVDEYKTCPENYPDITEQDFQLGPNYNGTIVTRKIEKSQNYKFAVKDGIFVETESEESSEPNT